MPTTEGYNGAYTGQQIDAAIAKANTAMQDPGGGSEGQILEKTEQGLKWSNKGVPYVGATPPEDTSVLWIDTANSGILKYHNGTGWVAAHSVWAE